MEIEKLKKVAEWLGYTWIDRLHIKNGPNWVVDGSQWRPDLETGRHFLVEMEKKLTKSQKKKYVFKLFAGVNPGLDEPQFFFEEMDEQDIMKIKTAPAELCFEKIMEVITPPKEGNK